MIKKISLDTNTFTQSINESLKNKLKKLKYQISINKLKLFYLNNLVDLNNEKNYNKLFIIKLFFSEYYLSYLHLNNN